MTGGIDTMVVDQWNDVLSSLRDEIGEAAFQSWLKPMTVREMTDGNVRISVPTRFMKDWVVAHYADRLGELWSAMNKKVAGVEIFVQADYGQKEAKAAAQAISDAEQKAAADAVTQVEAVQTAMPSPALAQASRANLAAMTPANATALEISAPLDPRCTFDNFVVGKPNEFAHAAAKRVAESTEMQFNPLFLYGGVGLGKTHLMHAIAWQIRQIDPNRTVIYMSAEKFMYRFIRALREQNTVDFKDQFRNVDVLMIDRKSVV